VKTEVEHAIFTIATMFV